MSDELPEGPRMSADFEERMRRGLSTMAVRERVRERRRSRAIAGGAVAAAVVAVAAVIGGQALAGLAPERDMAAPPAPTTSATSEPVPSETAVPAPTPTETAPAEPTPPPGFEGIAAGEAHVTASVPLGEGGDAGAAGGPDPKQIEGYVDVYVLCEGSGQVLVGDTPWLDCARLQEGTVMLDLGRALYRDFDDPEIRGTADFTGVIRQVQRGEAPAGIGVGGTATVYVDCWSRPSTLRVGGVDVTEGCGTAVDGRFVTEVGAWGIPFGPDQLIPTVEVGPDDRSSGAIRLVIQR